MNTIVDIKGVNKIYGTNHVVKDLNLLVEEGEFLTLLGSSGCGKTTTLRMIAGFEEPTTGSITVEGEPIEDKEPYERNVNTVFQSYALFPHMTIYDNIATVLRINNYDSNNIENRIDELLEMVDLDPNSYKYLYPCQLSGSQKQRVVVARAFATNPDIILMDEPFSALDPVTRSDLQDAVVKLQKQFKKTIVFVTHDMDEAIKLADKICIIQKGWIVQYDTPENILKNPANEYVQNFVGKNRLWSNSEFIKASDIMLKNPCKISVEFDRLLDILEEELNKLEK